MKTPENYMDYLAAHADCTEALLEAGNMYGREELDCSTEPAAVKLRHMISSVASEVHRLRGFVRLSQLNDKVLYGFLNPEHRTGAWVSETLSHRFPGMIIVLGNEKETWISIKTAKGVLGLSAGGLTETLEELRVLLKGPAVDASLTEKLWEAYYVSQYAKERKNPRLFGRNMPKKMIEAAGLKTEKKQFLAPLASFC